MPSGATMVRAIARNRQTTAFASVVIFFFIFVAYNDHNNNLCLVTVAPRYNKPRYNEDPVTTNNIWKPGRITVKYGETNPAITNPATTKSPL